MPSLEEIMKVSAQRGWEAVMIAFFAVTIVGLLIWLVKGWSTEAHDRESRMATRIDGLEMFTRTTLLEALRDNNKALVELTNALHNRPCLLSTEHQDQISNTIARAIAKEMKDK